MSPKTFGVSMDEEGGTKVVEEIDVKVLQLSEVYVNSNLSYFKDWLLLEEGSRLLTMYGTSRGSFSTCFYKTKTVPRTGTHL